MTISTNIQLLRPLFTIQDYTGLKAKNILSRFLPRTKWEKVVANIMFFTYLSVSISSVVKLLALEKVFFLISLICFRNLHAGPMVPDVHVLPCFSHMIINLGEYF